MHEGVGLTPTMEAELSNGRDFEHDEEQLDQHDVDKPEHERVEGCAE